MATQIFGNENYSQEQTPFVLNFASQQERIPSGATQLQYDSKSQMSEFSMQEHKVWGAQGTCTILCPVGNDGDKVWDYDVPD